MTEKKINFPGEIILEVTNACNLRCRYCHFHSIQAVRRRKIGYLPRNIWEKVLRELEEQKDAVTLMTHGAGEPLLHPDLLEILQRARRIPNLKLGFMCNGMLLNDEWSRRLVELQVDFIAFSIDGTDPVTHDFFRHKANLSRIEQNVFSLIREKERQGSALPQLSFNMVSYPEIEHQVHGYVNKWIPHASGINISRFRPVGSRRLWQKPDTINFRPCLLLYKQMVIGADGRVGLCCEDINLEVQVGSIPGDSIKTIWNHSPVLGKYRRHHEKGDVKGLALCRDCHIWAGNIPITDQEVSIEGVRARLTTTHAYQAYQKIF